MNFINLTHKTIRILDDNGDEVLVVVSKMKQYIRDLSAGLPNPMHNTRYIVSYAVLQALKNTRDDVISPDTSPQSVVRALDGQNVLGVKRFRKL